MHPPNEATFGPFSSCGDGTIAAMLKAQSIKLRLWSAGCLFGSGMMAQHLFELKSRELTGAMVGVSMMVFLPGADGVLAANRSG